MATRARPLSEQARASRPPDDETPTIALRVLIPMTLGFFAVAAVLLWASAIVSVECTRRSDGRVDVHVEERILGVWTMRRVDLDDVVRAEALQQTGGIRRGGRGAPGAQLVLTRRDGTEWQSTTVPRHVVGAGPREMASAVQAFVDASSPATLGLRWIPWLMCGLAVPFVLASGLFAMVWVNLLRRSMRGGA